MKPLLRTLLIAALPLIAACNTDSPTPTEAEAPPLTLHPQTNRAPATPFPFWSRILCCIPDGGAVVFYVPDPSAIPADFNLLAFFDPRALGSEFAVDGFVLIEDGAITPRSAHLQGLGAVPMWFFDAGTWEVMLADGVVTVPELEANQPVRGHASFYNEVLLPDGGGAPRNGLHVVARGDLDDGGTFRFQVQAPDPPFIPSRGKITFTR